MMGQPEHRPTDDMRDRPLGWSRRPGEPIAERLMNSPWMFALTREAGDSSQIVGYGMVLPHGSAYSVSWPASRGASFCSTATVEACAVLQGADLVWIG